MADQIRAPIAKLHYRLAAIDDGVLTQEIENDDAGRLPGLGEWGHVVGYRRVQLDRLANVEVVLDTELDAAAVREYGAHIVVVATGARWAGDGMNGITRAPIPGADPSLPHVLLPEDIMVAGMRPDGRRVAIVDCEGYFTAAGLAELLRGEGYEVTFVTPYDVVAPTCDQTLEGLRLRRHLHYAGIDLRTGLTPTDVEDFIRPRIGTWDIDFETQTMRIVLRAQEQIHPVTLFAAAA